MAKNGELDRAKSELARAHLKLYGIVQNVGYRFFIHRKAAAAGLTGWVCNCDSNGVEAVFEGDKKKIEQCIEECYKGPGWAKVERHTVVWQKPSGEFKVFEVK